MVLTSEPVLITCIPSMLLTLVCHVSAVSPEAPKLIGVISVSSLSYPRTSGTACTSAAMPTTPVYCASDEISLGQSSSFERKESSHGSEDETNRPCIRSSRCCSILIRQSCRCDEHM